MQSRPEIATTLPQVSGQRPDPGLGVPSRSIGPGHVAAFVDAEREPIASMKAKAEPDITFTALRLSYG